MAIKQSVCLPAFRTDLATERFFNELKPIGFAAVEVWGRDGDFDSICTAAANSGLKVCSMIGHNSISHGLNSLQEHNRIEKELRESIDIAAERKIPGIICFSGNRRDGITPEQSIEICAEGLSRITGYAEEKDVNLNVELLNSKVDHPDYECDNSAWGFELIRRCGSPKVKLLYDIYHMQIMEGDIIRTISLSIESIGHFHTAGNPGRHELDDMQELNYRGICTAISKLGYELYVGHEFFPVGDVLPSLKQAFELCDV